MNKILSDIRNYIKLVMFSNAWRKQNSHNLTRAINIFPINNVSVGKGTYGGLNIQVWNNAKESLKIGSYCSIAPEVIFILSGEHNYTGLSTYPFNTVYNKQVQKGRISKGNIIVEDDVWIGQRCVILSGVTIGQGAIIGAGSIVTKNIPPYAIYVGTKVLKYRFVPDTIKKLLRFDFSKLSSSDIKNNINLLNSDINDAFFENDFYKLYSKDTDDQ